MTTPEDIKLLLKSLSSCEDKSSDPLNILSSTLDKQLLERCNIKFEVHSEGIFIDLTDQKGVCIYKNKSDVITYFDGDESSVIWIILDELIYPNDNSSDNFFDNLFFAKKIKELLEKSEVISYHDELDRVYILLSETYGKIEIGYSDKLQDFCEGNYELAPLYDPLGEKLKENEYGSFFRDNFIKEASVIEERDERFYLALKRLPTILENSYREFELYKKKFSFEKFSSKLHDEKEKYVKRIQDELSEFLSKVNTLPIQFGVYILLVFRFKDEPIPLIGSMVLILVWSAFSVVSIRTMEEGFKSLKKNLDKTFAAITSESGIDEKILEGDKSEIDKRINGIETIMAWYKCVVIIFTLIFVVFCCWNIFGKSESRKSPNHPVSIEQDIDAKPSKATVGRLDEATPETIEKSIKVKQDHSSQASLVPKASLAQEDIQTEPVIGSKTITKPSTNE